MISFSLLHFLSVLYHSGNVPLCSFLGIHPAFFVLLCIALVSVMLGLVLYTTFRSNTQQKDLVEVFSCSYFELR